MSTHPDDNFTPGEDVTGYRGRRHILGKVSKVTPARVTVVWADGSTEVLHRRKWGRPFDCRRVTDEDRAMDQLEAAMLAWQQSHPPTTLIYLRHGHHGARISVDSIDADASTMEKLLAEVNAVREWILRRPDGGAENPIGTRAP